MDNVINTELDGLGKLNEVEAEFNAVMSGRMTFSVNENLGSMTKDIMDALGDCMDEYSLDVFEMFPDLKTSISEQVSETISNVISDSASRFDWKAALAEVQSPDMYLGNEDNLTNDRNIIENSDYRFYTELTNNETIKELASNNAWNFAEFGLIEEPSIGLDPIKDTIRSGLLEKISDDLRNSLPSIGKNIGKVFSTEVRGYMAELNEDKEDLTDIELCNIADMVNEVDYGKANHDDYDDLYSDVGGISEFDYDMMDSGEYR